ncbi:MAG: ornithine carbamoyltransferase [Mariprofundales bacterium]
MTRHFLSLLDLSTADAQYLLHRASDLKKLQKQNIIHHTLAGKTLAMLFEKSSTRTRVSFEVGMFQLGGHALFLHSDVIQLGRGEPIADTARVLSGMVDGLMLRTHEHETITNLAKHASIPVINGLTDYNHPCQILTDVFTFVEHRGDIQGATIAWIGDGNNMAHSWILGAALFGYNLVLATPKDYSPDPQVIMQARSLGASIKLVHRPEEAVIDADLVTTDVWASMGYEAEQTKRLHDFTGFEVNSDLMAKADKNALFMHCLPAHRGEEVSEAVLEGKQSVVWHEAENRLHAQKALLEFLLGK